MNYDNKKVIVRSDRAGIFYGEIGEKNGQNVLMTNVRRLWYWDGACSISELAFTGVAKPSGCKFTVTVDSIELFDVIEIILCTEEAVGSIEGVPVWKSKE